MFVPTAHIPECHVRDEPLNQTVRRLLGDSIKALFRTLRARVRAPPGGHPGALSGAPIGFGEPFLLLEKRSIYFSRAVQTIYTAMTLNSADARPIEWREIRL